MKRFFSGLMLILSFAAVSAVLLPVFLDDSLWPSGMRDYLERNAVTETGAVNIVSSIYLGYRAYDTLGETIVLLVAVTGTIGMIGYRSDPGAQEPHGYAERPHPRRRRTVLMEVVTGKLGPVVLVFGLYVMLFGHMSPGGGFQGGVVIASGIVFIALGAGSGSRNALVRAGMLSKIEALAYLAFLLASVSGIVAGAGFLANPLSETPLPPEGFIIVLNIMIGMKVGSGLAYMCSVMMGEVEA